MVNHAAERRSLALDGSVSGICVVVDMLLVFVLRAAKAAWDG